jgi:hypothetical protein
MRRLLLGLLTLGLALPATASAAIVTASFEGSTASFTYAVAMGSSVSTLTVDANPNGPGFRIRETGDQVVLSASPGAPCSLASGGVVCTALPLSRSVSITNAGGSTAPPQRDQVILAGKAHGDPEPAWSPVSAAITSASLIEIWLGSSGTGLSRVTGSDLAVGSPNQPADVVHADGARAVLQTDLRAGADRYEGGDSLYGDAIAGGEGADTLLGRGGDDHLDGGGGDDLIDGGQGRDALTGGAGYDTLSFDDPDRTVGITADFAALKAGTLGTSPYDDADPLNPAGSGDLYDATFEALIATPLADAITGSPEGDRIDGAGGDDAIDGAAGSDILFGGPGNDALTGGDGVDGLFGGAGDDVLHGRDGIVETLDCGDGIDPPDGDPSDVLVNCEIPPPPTTPSPSPAPTPPTYGPIALPQLVTTLASSTTHGARTTFKKLLLKGLPTGASVVIGCTAPKGSCPFGSKTRTPNKTGSVDVAKLLRGEHLRPGTVIRIVITAPGKATRTYLVTTRRRKAPTITG